MKSVSFSIKKKVINQFYNSLRTKLKFSYFDLDSLKYLSKRRVFKLLKLSFEAEGSDYNKRALKDIALVLSNLDFNNMSKKDIKWLYRVLLKRDIYFLIEKMIGSIYFALFKLIEFRTFSLTKESDFVEKIFEKMRILLI